MLMEERSLRTGVIAGLKRQDARRERIDNATNSALDCDRPKSMMTTVAKRSRQTV